MKSIVISGTVITNKRQAISLIERLNKMFLQSKSYELALVIDDYTERLVNAGFLTWNEV